MKKKNKNKDLFRLKLFNFVNERNQIGKTIKLFSHNPLFE